MDTTTTIRAGQTKLETAALRRARQERLRQLSLRSSGGHDPAHYAPRHRADVQADSVA